MGKELALPTEDAKMKLAELKKYMPGNQDAIYEFGRVLSTRLNPELFPEGFVLACALAIDDLKKGFDGFTHEPIKSSLVGYPEIVYSLLHMEIPQIAKAIFPEEFAVAVETFLKEVDKKSQEKMAEE